MLKEGQNRDQLQMMSLEMLVSADSLVRLIDVFVDILDMDGLGFEQKGQINNGAPAFPASALLKLYYYGYLNRVRSSRRLEREVQTNVEAMWLLKGLSPGYKTIANFRKDNARALEQAFYKLNAFLKGEGLFDEDKVAIDGSKFRAQNSKKNNYNAKKVEQHLDYINKQTQEYLSALDQLDSEEETESEREQRIAIAEQLDDLQKRQDKYELLQRQVEQAREQGETQISTVDADARALAQRMNIVEVGYNVLTSADLKNKLITNYEVSNKLDTYALSGMALKAREVLNKQQGEQLTVLADKGFDTGVELKACIENDVETLVSPKSRVNAKKEKAFNKDQFEYDVEQDVYVCPTGEQLRPNEKWYVKNNGRHRKSYRVRHFKLPFKICNACAHRLECAGQANLKNSKGRYVERSEYQEYIDENVERVKLNQALYRKRQQIIEHPFGTIKRQWGYNYTLLKTKEKVSGEFALIFTAYNLRRAVSILGVQGLIKRLKEAFDLLNERKQGILRRFKPQILSPLFFLLNF